MDLLGAIVLIMIMFPNKVGGPWLADIYKAFKREMNKDA